MISNDFERIKATNKPKGLNNLPKVTKQVLNLLLPLLFVLSAISLFLTLSFYVSYKAVMA